MSLLLLHMFQLEPVSLAPHASGAFQRRRRCHALHSQFQQVLTNVRRVIRVDDALMLSAHASAVIVFPDVNQQGIATILDRVYNSISLLQAETLVPPLNRETLIQAGIGSYQYPGASIDAMLSQASAMERCLTLRPVITTHWERGDVALPDGVLTSPDEVHTEELPRVPYMELPRRLPTRLTQLLPYALACELRCVPVGRDNYRLTVAMAEPTRAASIQRLDEVTGLSIFPVACDEEALNRLLTHPW